MNILTGFVLICLSVGVLIWLVQTKKQLRWMGAVMGPLFTGMIVIVSTIWGGAGFFTFIFLCLISVAGYAVFNSFEGLRS